MFADVFLAKALSSLIIRLAAALYRGLQRQFGSQPMGLAAEAVDQRKMTHCRFRRLPAQQASGQWRATTEQCRLLRRAHA